MSSVAAAKKDARTRVRSSREARPQAEIAAAGRRIARAAITLLPPSPALVSAYLALPSEPPTRDLIAAITDAGHRLVVPRITSFGLEWVEIDDTTEYSRGPLGISEPTGPALPSRPSPLAGAAVLFMPGLSVDRQGRRLGQGGGYYDRAIADVPRQAQGGPLRVGLLFDDEYVDDVPADDHDCSVDMVVTPERTITIRA